MNEEQGKIVLYQPTMANKAAEMFNAFNTLWPGGFGGGTPYTEQRVHDWLDKSSAIADLIAIDSDDELVGYCGLYPHWRDKNAAYITILGVTPKAKGKKYGKKLLIRSLEIAKEKGITRVDLNTWSGNMEAVPLYKKIGLYWVPDTTVYMQDFLPGLFRLPLVEEWFNKNPDWYSLYKRDLTQAPDKNIIDGMELYTYKFEKDGDVLIAEIDRYGWDFCGIERILDGKRIIAKTRIEAHNIYIGIKNSFTVILYSDYDDEVEVKLNVKEFEGLQWLETFPKSVLLRKGETVKISRKFKVNKDAKVFRDNYRACEKIKTTIFIGQKKIDLTTSGKIQSAVKIRSIKQNTFYTAPIGKEVKLPIDVINNTNAAFDGKVEVSFEGGLKKKLFLPIKLEPEEISGVDIPVTIPENRKSNKIIAKITPILKINNTKEKMPTYEIPIFVITKDLMEFVEIKENQNIFIATDKLFIRGFLEGGNLRIYQHEEDAGYPINHQSGPPYGITLDNTLLYHYKLIQEKNQIILLLTARSLQIPRLEIKKYIKVVSGQKEIEYWVKYINTDTKGSLHVSARTTTFFGGFNLNPAFAKRRAFTPFNGKIIVSDSLTNFLSDPLIPSDTSSWKETWTADEKLITKDYNAWIWNPVNIEKIKLRQGSLSQLESITKELKIKEIFEPVHLWFSFGYHTVQEVRKRWSQLIGNIESRPLEEIMEPDMLNALDIRIKDSKVLFTGETVHKKFEVFFASSYSLLGNLSLILPEGWQGSFITDKGKETVIPFPAIEPFKPKILEIELIIPERKYSPIENIKVHFNGECNFDFNNYILVTNKGEIKIEQTKLDGEDVFEISNGVINYKIASKIGGNLIRLIDSQGRSFLVDNFPKIIPKIFFEYYIGGLQPFIFHANAENPFTEPEETKSEIYKDEFWQGIKTEWTIKKDKQNLFGQKIEILWLTIPNSEIIRIVLTLNNESSRTIPWSGSIMADIGLQGTREENISEIKRGKDIFFHNKFTNQFISQSSVKEAYNRITKKDQSIAFVVPEGNCGTTTILDIGSMFINWLMGSGYTEPKSKSSIEFAIILNQPRVKMIELRKALGKY